MKKLIALVSGAAVLSPLLAFAQTIKNIDDVAAKGVSIGNLIIGISISLTVLWIIVSIVRYFIADGDDMRKNMGSAILYGVIALFAILSIWGLVAILRNTFRTNDSAPTDAIDRTSTLYVPGVTNRGGSSGSSNPYRSDPSLNSGTDVPAGSSGTYVDSFGNTHQIRSD